MKTFLRVVPLLLIVIGGCSRSAARRAQQFIASGDHFALADFHAAQGKLDEAEGELRRLLDSAANSDAARLRLARVLYRNGRRREADQILDVVLKHDARNVTPWLVRGQLRLADHQPDAAANAYAAALHIDPTSIEAATALTAI